MKFRKDAGLKEAPFFLGRPENFGMKIEPEKFFSAKPVGRFGLRCDHPTPLESFFAERLPLRLRCRVQEENSRLL
jgi:hypothetical protein